MTTTYQLWRDDCLLLAGCLSTDAPKRAAAKDAYNEACRGTKPAYYIRTDSGQLVAMGRRYNSRMTWRRSC